jgi:hypothetical protein
MLPISPAQLGTDSSFVIEKWDSMAALYRTHRVAAHGGLRQENPRVASQQGCPHSDGCLNEVSMSSAEGLAILRMGEATDNQDLRSSLIVNASELFARLTFAISVQQDAQLHSRIRNFARFPWNVTRTLEGTK